jgi:hypothetical protein
MEGYLAVVGAILALLFVAPIERLHLLVQGDKIERVLDFGEFLRRRGIPEGRDIYLSGHPRDIARWTKERAIYKDWENDLLHRRELIYEKFKIEQSPTLWIFVGGQLLVLVLAVASSQPLSFGQYAWLSAYVSLTVIGAGIVSLFWVYFRVGTLKGVMSLRTMSGSSLGEIVSAARPQSDLKGSSRTQTKPSRAESIQAHKPSQTLPTSKVKSEPISRNSIPKSDGDTPRLAQDNNSQLRAKGMQSFYENWKNCYFALGKPFGQSVEIDVDLVAEPNNPSDKNAVAVVCEGVVLGYIPKELTRDLKALIVSAGGVVRADAELWFDTRNGADKRNSVRLLVATPFRLQGS